MRHFFFDEVLDEGCSQQEAFARVQMGPMVESVLAGYHATVFCYGQTGSGAVTLFCSMALVCTTKDLNFVTWETRL